MLHSLLACVPEKGVFDTSVSDTSSPVGRDTADTDTDTDAPCPDGMVAWWRGEGDARDAVGGHDGSAVGGVSWSAGQVGSAFSFGGGTSVVEVADDPDFALTAAVSVEAWVRVDAWPTYISQILFRGDYRGGLDPYYLAVSADGRAIWHLENEGGGGTLYAPVDLGAWVHLVGTFDGVDQQIWLNGALAEEGAGVTPIGELDPTQTPKLGIGNLPLGRYDQPFVGMVDELVVYDRALDAAEIADHYAWGQAGRAFCE